MDELQAAILRAKLPSLESDNDRRRDIARRYDEALRDFPVTLLAASPGTIPAPHLYAVRTRQRDDLRGHLTARGIETAIHYPLPLHLQPAYAFLGARRGDFPVSEEASETVLSLPLYPTLSDDQVGAVVSAVGEFFGERR
jgi:dTDP-4-amino-4,6-dideoxygalactose transaminase